jgi:hypothetical protein
LRDEHGYEGKINFVRPDGESADDIYRASVIVGATNVENVIDVTRLAPGTLIVDDSWPHCMNGVAALTRFMDDKDILYTEGGFVRSPTRMQRISHVPPNAGVPDEFTQILFSSLTPHDITACVLSALISACRPDLAPTIGLIPSEIARQHWAALPELGFGAAELNYEGNLLDSECISAFRERFGKPVIAAPESAVAALQIAAKE